MSRQRKWKYLSCDFETTVYKGQVYTEVWASAVVELFTEDVKIFNSIEETLDYFISLKTNLVCYYHNLKFDGEFWMYYLLNNKKYQPALLKKYDTELGYDFADIDDMKNNTFSYVISDLGQWYSMTIKINDFLIEIRDSLKLLPFSVKAIGKAFNTKHQKLNMEYTGFRYSGCNITDEEMEYIKNDVLVVKEALEVMFSENHKKITIGSCCLAEYKSIIGKKLYESYFPDLTEIPIDPKRHNKNNADAWIRKSYKGGWCYLVKGKEGKQFQNGTTADVNSLYPSMMHSESGNKYPVGIPHFWTGSEIPKEALKEDSYFFIRIRTRFYLKKNYLPFIQIKGSVFYKGTECLESSDIIIRDEKKREKYRNAYYMDFDGNINKSTVELTMTQTDYALFLEHYNVIDFEILDGCWFHAVVGIFDEYIDKYKKIKQESKGALRTLAKLFLNNLYGKMATSDNSSFKVSYMKEDGTVGYYIVEQNDKKSGYIAVGSAITSYARNFTIRSAQKNYHGKENRGFIYADTDSIHCDLKPEEIVGIKIHDKDFCCWKLESNWDMGLFVRQKTYIEHIVKEDGEDVEPYYNIKCAGMPETCKNLFMESVNGYKEGDKKYDEEKLEFVKKKREITDFGIGLKVPGKLHPKRIKGGVILEETSYEMR